MLCIERATLWLSRRAKGKTPPADLFRHQLAAHLPRLSRCHLHEIYVVEGGEAEATARAAVEALSEGRARGVCRAAAAECGYGAAV